MVTRASGVVFLPAFIAAALMAACGGTDSSSIACSTDSECGPGQVCQSGVCKTQTATTSCTSSSDCSAGSDCVGGQCKPKFGACFADKDCKQGMHCNITNNVCIPGVAPDGGQAGDGGADIGASEMAQAECTSDLQCSMPHPTCVNGSCKSCHDTGCASQEQCDTTSGMCVPKSTDGGIPDAGTHDAGGWDTGAQDTGGNDCSTTGCQCGTYCDQGSGACIKGCQAQGDCCAGDDCINNQCTSVTSQCLADADCKSTPGTPHCEKVSGQCVECTQDFHCSGSTCDKSTWTCAPKQPGDVGEACTADSDCQMGDMCITEKDSNGKDTGFVGGYCSEDCTSSQYCDSYVASCIAISSSPAKSECFLDCVTDSECRTGYICADAGGFGECYPRCDNAGASCATGYVCQAGTGKCEGTQDVEDPCGGTYAECKTGLVCAGYSGEQYYCYKECDPVSSSGPFCSSGEVCSDLGTTGICDYGGTTATGGDCTSSECIAGDICAGTSSYKCYKGCDKKDGSPGCSSSKTCTLLSGETRLGICE